MSIFERIRNAILGDANAATPAQAASASPLTPPAAPDADPVPPLGPGAPQSDQIAERPPIVTDPATGAPPPPQAPAIDIADVLDQAARSSGQKLDWRHSIVDLMKAVGMDASMQERKELASELGYSGDKSDSAAMNTFLHKTLMKRLSANGGKVPPDLLD
ncbi:MULTISPECIES: DUF3597 domain-containing protein [unclassified Rhizobium]|uniref:DUF3597 domain-containing protein n=1 Tax=unclassified Rhizobium TaxID=2613769 RepID=UPI00146D8F44|nr:MULTISPECIES: DUF3597 domain-containing protein [unclassified Rhizobium]MBD9454273.1 DUF3597 domain-containing protein [Rhizobium sp. RHZ02]NMN70830.1 putative membrane protein [Rhizobium sp. 57MFTsu3.2]